MALTNEWDGDWDEIATDHVFSDFRAMTCHLYYRFRGSLDDLLMNINATHPMVTREQLIEKFKEMELPLKEGKL